MTATDLVPRDRVIDGVEQSGVLLLAVTHGRRDSVHIIEGPTLKSVVKKMITIPPILFLPSGISFASVSHGKERKLQF